MTAADEYLLQQIAAVSRELAAVKRQIVTYRKAVVTAVDPAGAISVAVEGNPDLTIEWPVQFLPEVGDIVTLPIAGATPQYQPGSIAAGAITSRELDESLETTIDEASANATLALASADGKNAVVFATTPPTVAGGTVGDIWWQRSGTVIVGTWEWDGDSWEPRKFGDATFDTVSAAKIVTGQLSVGVTIYLGDPAGTHTRISSTGIVYYAADPVDGIPNEVGRGGRTSGGTDPVTGEQTWIIDEFGNPSFNNASVNTLRVDGTLLEEILVNYAGGTQVWYPSGKLQSGIALEFGVAEVYKNLARNRNYLVVVPISVSSTVNDGEALIRVRYTDDGTRPTTASPIAREEPVTCRVAGRWNDHKLMFLFQRDADDGQDVKFLVTVARGTGQVTGTVATEGNPPTIIVNDNGPYTMPSGTNLNDGSTGGSSTAAPTRHVDYIAAVWARNFTGAGAIRTDTEDLMQGYSTANGDGKAMVGFGNLSTLLSGATVRSIRLYLYAYSWYNPSGGTAIIGSHAQTSVPATFSGTTNRLQVPGWARAQGRWVDLTAWASEFQAGTTRGIDLGPSGGTDLQFAGRFAGITDPITTRRPTLEVVYYK